MDIISDKFSNISNLHWFVGWLAISFFSGFVFAFSGAKSFELFPFLVAVIPLILSALSLFFLVLNFFTKEKLIQLISINEAYIFVEGIYFLFLIAIFILNIQLDS